MYILGINAYHGDSSACLIKDGNVVCACEEERITRVKHWAGFPIESIKFCLDDQKISIKDIDYITIILQFLEIQKQIFLKKLFIQLRIIQI